MTNWEKFHLQISKYSLYPEDTTVVDAMLQDLAKQKITAVGKRLNAALFRRYSNFLGC